MSLLSKGRVASSHIFIILLNKWIYPAHKLANTFSPRSTCWHFPADGSAEGEMRKVVSDKGQPCLVAVFHHQRHWPAHPLTQPGACWEGQSLRSQTGLWRTSRERQEVKSAWPLRTHFLLSCIKFIHTVMSWTQHTVFFFHLESFFIVCLQMTFP